MINIKALIVHQVNKEQNGVASLHTRNSLLPINDLLTDFVDSVRKAYYKKSNPIYGIFNSNATSFPYQNMIKSYLDEDEDVSFLQFSKNAVEHFKTIINDIPQATGGYMVFAHFEDTSDFIMALMLNNKTQYNIDDDNLVIKEIRSLDIDRLDVANFVNLNRWQEESQTYLSFAKGRKDISNYFRKFIGCTDEISAKEQSRKLKKALLDYFDSMEISNSEKEDKRNRVYEYCLDKIKRKEDISLSHISSLIDDENPELFVEFAAGEDYQVNTIVKGHKQTLKNLKFYVYRSKDLTIEFDSALINDNRIIYNQSENELLIKEVPSELRQQILNLTESDNE